MVQQISVEGLGFKNLVTRTSQSNALNDVELPTVALLVKFAWPRNSSLLSWRLVEFLGRVLVIPAVQDNMACLWKLPGFG